MNPSRADTSLLKTFSRNSGRFPKFAEYGYKESLISLTMFQEILITYIFCVSLKFGAYYITCQWGDFRIKNTSLYLHTIF